jgi:hypothetical protein
LSWDPPQFNAGKVTVRYLEGGTPSSASASPGAERRRYTLTHNDLTGALTLSVGREYNAEQVAGWCAPSRRATTHRHLTLFPLTLPRTQRYTRLLRDEVLAEWAGGALHVHCHVRAPGDWWLAPSLLRGFIFRREMPLVLDTVSFADRDYLRTHAQLAAAPVLVHFHEANAHTVEQWGSLGLREQGVALRGAALTEAQTRSPEIDACAQQAPPAEQAQAQPSRPRAATAAPLPRFGDAGLPSRAPLRPSLAPVGATARGAAPGGDSEILVGHWSRKAQQTSRRRDV